MRILWFTNTPSLYMSDTHPYHGAGWIESLEYLVAKNTKIDLGICFLHGTGEKRIKEDGTSYYPILKKRMRERPIRSIIRNWKGSIINENHDKEMLSVIHDFKPDIIQIFGTEGVFANIQSLTKIPVVIHLQGLINPYLNTYYPVNQSELNFIFNKEYLIANILGTSPAYGKRKFAVQADRERKYLTNARFITGRTEWDKMISYLYNPNTQYHYVSEVLRPPFYENQIFESKENNRFIKLISTISPTVYKGLDVILKTANKLSELTDIHFRWDIIGIDKNDKLLKHFEKSLKISHRDVNIHCQGRKNSNKLISLLQVADLFIHPSYIDNSPNSVCEAQILGLPVIATNVGGIPSLIKDRKTGFLVPSNGVYEIIELIRDYNINSAEFKNIGKKARKVAQLRHCKKTILSDLLNVYESILNSN